MKSGNYIIKFSKQAEKDKRKLKNSGLDKTCKTILNLMKVDPWIYRQYRIVYEVLEKNEIYIIRMWTHYEIL